MTDRPSALFVVDGDHLVPTEFGRGPWSPDALHGGPTAAAVTREVEAHLRREAGEGAMEMARLTLELLKPVPVEPLRVTARTVRPGRKVTLVEASVVAVPTDRPEVEVARAVALAIRRQPLSLPAQVQPIPPPPGGPAPGTQPTPSEAPPDAGQWVAFHNSGVEMSFAAGAWRQPGPVSVWIRLLVPVVAGESPSPAVRAVAVADFGNGVSSELDFGSWRFLNPELTVHIGRPPLGEWICLDARTVLGPLGAGLAESALSDQLGVFGRAVQSLFIEPA